MSGHQAFVAALFDAELPYPDGLSTWNGSDPAARFAVYRNNVIVSLIDALADTYPVTQELVGEAFFRAMARLYIGEAPPHSRVLAFYGASFPDFIEQFPPAASVPYLADVARLEMLRVEAYHAADTSALSAEVIAQALANADSLPQQLITFHPSLRLLQSQYAVVSLWAAHQGITEISTVDPLIAESALVVRPHLNVEIIRLDHGASDFVSQLFQGNTLGEALEHASEIQPDFDLAGILGLLIQSQAIVSMKIKE